MYGFSIVVGMICVRMQKHCSGMRQRSRLSAKAVVPDKVGALGGVGYGACAISRNDAAAGVVLFGVACSSGSTAQNPQPATASAEGLAKRVLQEIALC